LNTFGAARARPWAWVSWTEPAYQIGRASFLFTDFESSPGTETVRVRIAGWSGCKIKAANEEETLPKRKNQRPLLEKEGKKNELIYLLT
jgi:hypothetical protein